MLINMTDVVRVDGTKARGTLNPCGINTEPKKEVVLLYKAQLA